MKNKELLNKVEKKKLILRSCSERGDKKILFIDRNLLINFEGVHCFRSQDFTPNQDLIKHISSSKFADWEKILIHHAKEVTLSWQTLDQLKNIDIKLNNYLDEWDFKLIDQINCIHDENIEGNEALSVSCSCHPLKGGMFLDSSVKHKLSLSKCYYMFEKEAGPLVK